MFYFLGVIVGLFVAIIFLLGDEFVRAAQIRQYEENLSKPKQSFLRMVVIGGSREINCIQDILKQLPSDKLYLVHNDVAKEKYDIYKLNSYDAILQATQLYQDYSRRDRFKIYD